MHIHHRVVFAMGIACGAAAFAVAPAAAQGRAASSSAQASSQPATLTGCVEYGPRDTYVLTTVNAPAQPALSNEASLEHQEVAAVVRSYQLEVPKSQHLSQLVGAKVRTAGTVSRVTAPVSAAPARGRGPATAPPMIDQLNASSVQKLADYCDPQLTMFAK